MQRYFVPKTNWNNETVVITGEDVRHIKTVMRKQLGDLVICNRLDGEAAICSITKVSKDTVFLQVVEWLTDNNELPVHVTIAQGLPKGNKLEFILQKGTELGANQFCFFQAERSIAKWDFNKGKQKIKRFEKIVKEASEQCQRNQIPIVNEPSSLEKLLELCQGYDIMLFAYEEEVRNKQYHSFAKSLSNVSEGDKIIIFIGPEGGFSPEEAEFLKLNGVLPVRLGRRILRTESASLYALASISYQFEELGC